MCQSQRVGADTREMASELRAVAPLVVTGRESAPVCVGSCTLVTNGSQTIAFSSADLLRQAGEPLAIALTLDCKKTIPVSSWTMGRVANMGVIELGAPFPLEDGKLDVAPISLGSVYATVDTRGAPSALVTIERDGSGVKRRVIPVHVDAVDGGGMSDDVLVRLASPDSKDDVEADIDGGSLFSWLPPDPVLGRPSEVVVVALAVPYRANTFNPRTLPAIAELFGLEDLGRALPWQGDKQDDGNTLGQIAGEIKEGG